MMKLTLLALAAVLLALSTGCDRDRTNPPGGSATKTVEATLKAFEDSPLYPVPQIVREEPKEEETDCSGLVQSPDVATNGRSHLRRVGRYAAGSMVGSSFTPMIYFETLESARKCAKGLEVREWSDRKAWVAR